MRKLKTLLFLSALAISTQAMAESNSDLEKRINQLENQIQRMQYRQMRKMHRPMFMNFDDMFARHDAMMQKMFDKSMESSFSVNREKDRILVKAKLKNVDKDDIDISVEDYVMTIESTKSERKEIEGEDSKSSSIKANAFIQQISLPRNADIDDIETDFDDGELIVEIPLEEDKTKLRKIKVR